MRDRTFAPSRILIYLLVSLIAAAYLAPLAVVVLNSLRTNQEIAQASMIGWPKQWAWSNYLAAWSGFCVAETCAGMGIPVHFETEVTAVTIHDDGTSTTTVRDVNGQTHEIDARFFVDGSGYCRVLPTLFGMNEPSTQY